jgi:hypothetical protein
MHVDQDFLVIWGRCFYFFVFKNIRRSVSAVYYRFHQCYLVSIQKRRLSPDSGVGQQIQILKVLVIFTPRALPKGRLRFEFVGRLDSGKIHHFWTDTI